MTEMRRVTRGIWRPPDEVDDLAGRCAAILHAMPPDAVLAGRTAAQLHGVWLPELPTSPIELIVPSAPARPRDLAASIRPEVRARRRTLEADEVVVVDGLPLTSEARTWCDLAEVLSMADLVAAGDSVLRGVADPAELAWVLKRAVHRRGVVKARAALPWLNARSRSRPESHLRYALVSAGLPEPAVNEPIFSERGEWLAEPDLHYRRARTALEYNGAEHARPDRMRRDITRDLDYQLAEWRAITFGPAQVFGRPAQLATFVRTVLLERDPLFPR